MGFGRNEEMHCCSTFPEAAPTLKLWPEYWSGEMPDADNALLTRTTKAALVKGHPSVKQKNGPGSGPRTLT